ncbi:MAG: hypothetical protein HY544_05765 [Candidatus Diapherotrites archaeon]|uniref:HEPN domain-containing protein n=1 Tax=Candidatus Iainarchaeum sp. TaxID=3101447 RepID=A0A8T3YPP8_9ARCH|nr:hypothetical protein [Candidatus Diapherotrites archaeon]
MAEEQFEGENYHTAAHLYINAAINYQNAICQKFLKQIPSHKQHSDTSYFDELRNTLGSELQKYADAYKFLVGYKSQADYGTELSFNIAKQIRRRARTIKEIAEHLL